MQPCSIIFIRLREMVNQRFFYFFFFFYKNLPVQILLAVYPVTKELFFRSLQIRNNSFFLSCAVLSVLYNIHYTFRRPYLAHPTIRNIAKVFFSVAVLLRNKDIFCGLCIIFFFFFFLNRNYSVCNPWRRAEDSYSQARGFSDCTVVE